MNGKALSTPSFGSNRLSLSPHWGKSFKAQTLPSKVMACRRCWRNRTAGRAALDLARTDPSILSASLSLGTGRGAADNLHGREEEENHHEVHQQLPGLPADRSRVTPETKNPNTRGPLSAAILSPSHSRWLPSSLTLRPPLVGSCRWASGRRSRRRGLTKKMDARAGGGR